MDILASSKHSLGRSWTEFEAFFHRTLQSDIELLNTINQHLLQHAGKQLRPLLTLMAAGVCGEITGNTHVAATAVEMVHTASLLHDDVVDNADRRRGAPSVKALWKSHAAVLTGDYWLSRAFRLVVEHREHRLLPWFTGCLVHLSEGELLQLSKALKLDTGEEDYYTIIGKKTASLMATGMAAGAITAGADEDSVQKMYDAGYQSGLAFQIRDDIFDYQKTNLTGKPAGNDVREQKITLPLLCALKKTDNAGQARVLGWVKKAAKRHRYAVKVIRFVRDNGGLDDGQRLLQEHTQQALTLINGFPHSNLQQQLAQLVQQLTERKK